MASLNVPRRAGGADLDRVLAASVDPESLAQLVRR